MAPDSAFYRRGLDVPRFVVVFVLTGRSSIVTQALPSTAEMYA